MKKFIDMTEKEQLDYLNKLSTPGVEINYEQETAFINESLSLENLSKFSNEIIRCLIIDNYLLYKNFTMDQAVEMATKKGVFNNNFSIFVEACSPEKAQLPILILKYMNADQKKFLMDLYDQRPNLFLFCTRELNQKLMESGFDIATYDEIHTGFNNDMSKDILQDYTFDICLQKYNKLGTSGCFDYVKADGNCAVWSSMQAFRGEKIKFEDPEEYAKMVKLREIVADLYCKHDIEKYEEHKTPGTWVDPVLFLSYLSELNNGRHWCLANERFDRSEDEWRKKEFRNFQISSFEDVINGCPFVFFINDNHYVNLKPDFETRKKFLPLLYDFYCSYKVYNCLVCCSNPSNTKKNEFVFRVLDSLFQDFQRDSVNDIMDNFLKDVPHKYKSVLTFRLIFYIFEKYKVKVLDKLDFKLKSDEFLSDVLVDFKKEVVDKDPKFGKKQNIELEKDKDKRVTNTDYKTDNGQQNIPKDPQQEPKQDTEQTTQKPEINEPQNNQQTGKEKEDTKKDEINNKDKPRSKSEPKTSKVKKFFFILACIFSFSLVYWFSKLYEKLNNNRDKLSPDNKNNSQSKDEEIETNEIKESVISKSKSKEKPLSNLSNVNSQIENNAKKNLPDRKSIWHRIIQK